MRRISFSASLASLSFSLLTGCASTHDLNNDGFSPLGGGFADEQILPGLYRMTAIGNMALWSNSEGARKTWNQRADHLCGVAAHQAFGVSVEEGRLSAPPVVVPNTHTAVHLDRYNTALSGYLLCASSNLSVAEAMAYVERMRDLERRNAAEEALAHLADLGGSDCGGDTAASAENYYLRGKTLMRLERYSDAYACFYQAQSMNKEDFYAKESCYMLGIMHETGMGTKKDLQAAKVWFGKAGI